MKVLFQIKNTETGKVVEGEKFVSKQEAKKRRRELNGQTKEGKERLTHVVTLGPDHDKYEGTPKRQHARKKEVEELVQ